MNNIDLNIIAKRLAEKFAKEELSAGYQFIGYHPYTDESGNVVYMRIRLKNENGKKWIRPFYFDEATQDWLMREPTFTSGKLLYRLHELTSKLNETVWIYEGETCVEAIEKYGFLSTTSGGSSSAVSANWSYLKDRNVIVWPDNDSAGFNFAIEITKRLENIGCTVQWVDIKKLNLPDGGDIVDWLNNISNINNEEIKAKLISIPLVHARTFNSEEAESKDSKYINYRTASDIQLKAYNWLWPSRFAKGKVSMISGNPGLGKSQLCASMAATITHGGTWPDKTNCEAGSVIFLSAEDDPADTIVPRLKAVNGDLTRIRFIESVTELNDQGEKLDGQFSLATDLEVLERLLLELKDVAAIFIDPITAYLGNTDDHKNARVRSILSPLSKLAEKYNVAMICISHHNKGGSQEALMRVIGSIGFVAAARAAFAVVKDKDDESRRLFLPLKNNIGNDKTGLAFKIESHDLEDNIQTSRILWSDEEVTVTADEAMSPNSDENKSALDEAIDFLKDILKDGEECANDIIKWAEENNISKSTLLRAKKALGVKISRKGYGKDSKSVWSFA